MIAFLQSIVLVLTIALQPTTPPDVRQHIFVEVTRIMSTVEMATLPINNTPMNEITVAESASSSAPTPAPSAPAASSTPPAVQPAPVDLTPNVEFLAVSEGVQWKTSGVNETLQCTLNGVEVAQEGSQFANPGEHTLRCVGVKSGTVVQRTVVV